MQIRPIRHLVAVFCFALGFYYTTLQYTTPVTLTVQDVIFGSDTLEVVNTLLQPTFDGDMRKHTLYSATLAPPIRLLGRLPFVSPLRSICIVLALLAALNVTGVFLLLRQIGNSLLSAHLFTAVYAISFANLVSFSIPETYAMSNLWIITYLTILQALHGRMTQRGSLLLATVAGAASLYNPPLLSMVGIHSLLLAQKMRFREWAVAALSSVALGGGGLAAVNVSIYGSQIFGFWQEYAGQWASPRNLVSAGQVGNVIVDFFLFSIASPVVRLPAALGLRNWISYFQTPSGAVLAVVAPVALVYAVVVVLRTRNTLDISVLAWIGALTAFYIVFNPTEAMLYASQILAPLVMLLARAFERLPGSQRRNRALLGAVLITLAVNNVSALYKGIPELQREYYRGSTPRP